MEISALLCSHFLLSISTSDSDNLPWAPHSPWTTNSAFFQSRHGDLSFRQSLHTFQISASLSTKSLQHLKLTHYLAPTSWCCSTRVGVMRWVHHWWCLLATACCRQLQKTIRDSGGCDCRGKIVVLGVEAVSFRGVVDRRVLTADVEANLGLITCEMCGFDQTAKLKSSARSGAAGSLDSSHWQWSLCSRRWCGTEGRKWVKHIKEWSMKHVLSGWLLPCPKVQHIPNLSHTQVRVMICDQVRDTLKNCACDKVFCLQYHPHVNIVCDLSCDECKRSNEPAMGLSQTRVHLVTAVASLFTGQRMSGLPILAKSRNFRTIRERSFDNFPVVSSSSFSKWWLSRHGMETLYISSAFCLPVRNIFPLISSHVLPCQKTKLLVSREISPKHVSIELLRQRFVI